MQLSFHFVADPCYNYKNLSEANRNRIHITLVNGPVLCDKELSEGWYRFVGAAGTKMPTTHVPANKCGAAYSGWLHGTHPTVEHDKVSREVCFSTVSERCKHKAQISVKNCSSYYIYKLQQLRQCDSRYCGTD